MLLESKKKNNNPPSAAPVGATRTVTARVAVGCSVIWTPLDIITGDYPYKHNAEGLIGLNDSTPKY
jgi:hypothetical protein